MGPEALAKSHHDADLFLHDECGYTPPLMAVTDKEQMAHKRVFMAILAYFQTEAEQAEDLAEVNKFLEDFANPKEDDNELQAEVIGIIEHGDEVEVVEEQQLRRSPRLAAKAKGKPPAKGKPKAKGKPVALPSRCS
jgi:hypothetical protein